MIEVSTQIEVRTHTHTLTSDLIRSKPDEIVCAFGYVSNIMLFEKSS
jgi:hypothetical protein